MKEEVNKSTMKFKSVQTKIFQLNAALTGISSLVPISFDKEYTSIGIATIHGSLIDFRFRVQNARLKPKEQTGDTFMENGILVEKKYQDE